MNKPKTEMESGLSSVLAFENEPTLKDNFSPENTLKRDVFDCNFSNGLMPDDWTFRKKYSSVLNAVFPNCFSILRPLSQHSSIFLCREDATDRLVTIKFYQDTEEHHFRNHIKSIIQMEKSGITPRLLLASPGNASPFKVLVFEFLSGEGLDQLLKDHLRRLSHKGVTTLLKGLESSLARIHHIYQISHGDISPKNILCRINFLGEIENLFWLDWDFSQPLLSKKYSSYSSFHGTPEFMRENEMKNSPVNRDRFALQKIIELILIIKNEHPTNSFVCVKKTKLKERLKWIKTNFYWK